MLTCRSFVLCFLLLLFVFRSIYLPSSSIASLFASRAVCFLLFPGYFLLCLLLLSNASSLSYTGVAVAMDWPNLIVDEEGDVRGHHARGGALMLDDVSAGRGIPPEPGEIDHGLGFEWDVDPMVREVF